MVLGKGKRLFDAGRAAAALRLVDSAGLPKRQAQT